MAKDFHQKPLSHPELAEFCNQMSIMLHSGIPALEGIHLLLEDSQSKAELELLTKLKEELELHGCFYDAAASASVFPAYALHMIRLGEETGTLDQVMYGLFLHYTREANLSRMLRSSLVYPAMMLGMMALVVILLLTKVMPVFNQVFQQMGQTMTGFSAGLLEIGEMLSRYSVLFILLAVLLIACLVLLRKHLPFYRNIQEKMAACRFADGMSIALKSGMTPEQGLTLTEQLVENASYQARIADCKIKLMEGSDLASALQQSKLFTGSYARLASIAGKAGTLDEAMKQISSEYEYSVNEKINGLIAMLEPTLVIVLSLIVGAILFSVMLPLLGILSGL